METRYGEKLNITITLSFIHTHAHVHTHTHTQQEPDDLFETVSQALLNAVDRDAISGWGAVVHIM